MSNDLIDAWAWPQYVVIGYLVVLTVFWFWMKFTVGKNSAPGLKLWVLTAWSFFVYTLYAGGFWK